MCRSAGKRDPDFKQLAVERCVDAQSGAAVVQSGGPAASGSERRSAGVAVWQYFPLVLSIAVV